MKNNSIDDIGQSGRQRKTLPYMETFSECAEDESKQKTDQRRCLHAEDIEEPLMQITIL